MPLSDSIRPLSIEDSERVLVGTPEGRDGALTAQLLREAGFEAVVCASVEELCFRMEEGASVAVVDERLVDDRALVRIQQHLERQGDWSDFPFVVFGATARSRAHSHPHAPSLGNVTLLDRPVEVRTMLAAVHAALRGRRRQYQVRRAIALREQFLAMLGHELRNPLAAIRLAIESLEAENKKDKHWGVVDRQSTHLMRMVDDLLDVARVTHGKVSLHRAVVDLSEIVRGCFIAQRPTACAASLAYSIVGDDRRLWVDGDRMRLEQVTNNLIANAIKYTPEGGKVTVELRANEDFNEVRVVDTGIGMEPATIDRVFDVFTQAEQTLDRSRGGMGLGLTVVRGLVELHGGTATARSAGLGKGSEFLVRLPRKERPHHMASSVPPRALIEPMKIVVVDDNEDLREMLGEMLALAGHEVVTAAEGVSGLARILEVEPDTAFVDLGLPLIDGYEVARRVRVAGRDTRLVAISGYGQPEDRMRALDAGFDEHLKKPVGFSELSGALRRKSAPPPAP